MIWAFIILGVIIFILAIMVIRLNKKADKYKESAESWAKSYEYLADKTLNNRLKQKNKKQ